MELKEWAKVFRGLQNFTSGDKTPLMLNHVYVASDTRIEATDGHKLIRLDVKAPHGWAPGFYEPKQAIALLKAGVQPQPVARETVKQNCWEWPNTDAVIPAIREGEDAKGAPVVGLCLAYLAEIGEGLAAILGVWGYSKSSGAKVRVGETETDPVRFDADAYGEVSAVVVLMPMRL